MWVFHFMFLPSTMCLTMLPKVTDDVKLGSATINGQSIGVASTSTGFTGMRFLISQNSILTKLTFDKALTVFWALDPST